MSQMTVKVLFGTSYVWRTPSCRTYPCWWFGIAEAGPSGREHRSQHIEIMVATVHAALRRDSSRYRPRVAGKQHGRKLAVVRSFALFTFLPPVVLLVVAVYKAFGACC